MVKICRNFSRLQNYQKLEISFTAPPRIQNFADGLVYSATFADNESCRGQSLFATIRRDEDSDKLSRRNFFRRRFRNYQKNFAKTFRHANSHAQKKEIGESAPQQMEFETLEYEKMYRLLGIAKYADRIKLPAGLQGKTHEQLRELQGTAGYACPGGFC